MLTTKHFHKHLLAMAATMIVTQAQALEIGTDTSPYAISSSSATLAFAADLLYGYRLGGIKVTATEGATYADGVVSTSVVSVLTDDLSGAFTSMHTTGGAQQRIGPQATVAGGVGAVTLSNLTVDLVTHSVLADVMGDNGLLPQQQVTLFTFDGLEGDLSFQGAGTYSVTSGALKVTQDGVLLLSKGLALTGFAVSALNDLEDWGRLQATVTVSAVPEPASWALMGLGTLGVFWMRRRSLVNG